MQWKINDTIICLRMGKTYTAKTPPGDFQVTIPEIPLLSQEAVTSKVHFVKGLANYIK